MTTIEAHGLVVEIDDDSWGIKISSKRQPHLQVRVVETTPKGMLVEVCDLSVELRVHQFLSPKNSPANGSPIHNDCCYIGKR